LIGYKKTSLATERRIRGQASLGKTDKNPVLREETQEENPALGKKKENMKHSEKWTQYTVTHRRRAPNDAACQRGTVKPSDKSTKGHHQKGRADERRGKDREKQLRKKKFPTDSVPTHTAIVDSVQEKNNPGGNTRNLRRKRKRSKDEMGGDSEFQKCTPQSTTLPRLQRLSPSTTPNLVPALRTNTSKKTEKKRPRSLEMKFTEKEERIRKGGNIPNQANKSSPP